MSFVVLIPDRLQLPVEVEEEVFPADTIFIAPCVTSATEIRDEDWRRADAVLCWHDVPITRDVVALLDNAKVIVRYGVGVDSVDVEAATGRGIVVCNVPDYGTGDVADHTSAMLTVLMRGILRYDAAARANNWAWETGADLRRISECRIGIIGLGRIGTSVALRMKAFGAHIVFFDPYKEDGYDKALGIERTRDLYDLAATSDAVTLHTPLTPETTCMVGARFVGAMKEGSVFINTARGGLMDLDAVYEGLDSGRIAAVGLDVLPEEPPRPDHPLVKAWLGEMGIRFEGRIIITPHCAFFNHHSYTEMRRKAAEEALRVLRNEPPHNRVS